MADATTERSLLFGILAFQMDLMGRDELVDGLNAWVSQKDRALGEILVERGVLEPSQRATLEPLVDEHARRHGGDPRQSLAALGGISSLREALAALGDEQLRATLPYVGSEPNAPEVRPRLGEPTASGGRFRVLRPHARGGLGQVHIARDEELGREVALKEMRPQLASDPQLRERFVLEAEITGNLEHPGIVPVYGLGRDAQGRPFYAMRFIQGDSLREAIADYHRMPAVVEGAAQSLQLRRLLGRFIDVCEAIAYAHGRGVLHRDLKPENVMLGRYGETLVVDWGLAKPLGHVEAGESPTPAGPAATLIPPSGQSHEATVSGQALGTPGYMSPEQARGDIEHLGPATDVYSLGGILYCLLTGRPPVTGATLGEVLERSIQGEIPAPRSIRREVPLALEAVCLKALATDPAARYPSAHRLAEEVEHWLGDEPVEAYREGLSQRVARWMRHHRAATQAAGFSLLVLAAAATVAAGLINAARTREVQARQAEGEARRLAERRSAQARSAVDAMYTEVAEKWLAQQPRLEPLQREFLEKALAFYSDFARDRRQDRSARAEVARANRRAGEIRSRLGQDREAVPAYENAIRLYDSLIRDEPGEVQHQMEQARARHSLGYSLWRSGVPARAEPALRSAVAAWETLLQRTPGDRERRRGLASACNALGGLLTQNGRLAEAEPVHRRAVGIREALVLDDPKDVEARKRLADSQNNLASLLYYTGRLGDAEAAFRRAAQAYDQAMAAAPAEMAYVHDAANTLGNLGAVLDDTGRFEEAESAYHRSIALSERLTRDYPRTTEYRSTLGVALGNLANTLYRQERWVDAEALYRRAIGVQQEMVRDSPEGHLYRRELQRNLTNLGNMLSRLGREPEAERLAARAVAEGRALVAAFPGNANHKQGLADALWFHSGLAETAGRWSEAEQEDLEALALQEEILAGTPSAQVSRVSRCGLLGDLGRLAARRGATAQGRALLERCLTESRKTLKAVPGSPTLLEYLRNNSSLLNELLLNAGDLPAAVGVARALGRGAPGDPVQALASARLLARCSGRSGSGVVDGADLATEALALLRQAAEHGHDEMRALAHDPDLGGLLDRADARAWYGPLIDTGFPADAFAH